ncbi:MAG: 6-hydroxymethylpterin diphosphokinase MptE-like protein [Thermoplasmataceae archaeon]
MIGGEGHWQKRYDEICHLLQISKKDDLESADHMAAFKNYSEGLLNLAKSNSNRRFFIIGNGPPKTDISGIYGKGVIIVADSAIWKIEKPYVPEIIVTDLDGDVDRILEMSEQGSIVFIHSHGDNIKKLDRFCPLFNGRFIPTTQVPGYRRIYNFGGFTDGDRAAYIADFLGALSIELVDFDFSIQHGKAWNERKDAKLKIARDLLKDLERFRGDKILGL